MNQWDMVGKAIEVAVKAHKNQPDKSGMPYILHPLRVMLEFKDPVLMSIAVLHDVVEDTSVTIQDLRDMGFTERILRGVEDMTHKKETSREEYYSKIKKNHDAREVKIKDVFDNISPDRMGLLTPADRIRLTIKYGKALETIYSLD